MNPHLAVVDERLRRAKLLWNWLRVVRISCQIGVAWSLLMVLWGAGILAGLIQTKAAAVAFLEIAGAACLVAWVAALALAVAGSPGPGWLARAIERVDPRLQDRLNTLVFLREKQTPAAPFLPRIAAQIQRVLNDKSSPAPFSAAGTIGWVGYLVLSLVSIWILERRFEPWDHLRASPATIEARGGSSDSFSEPVLTNRVEQSPAWGEVRVSEPGTDLKVTKVDVVPLAIEAAANRDLRTVSWRSSVNGGPEQLHSLPAPKDPRYASYRPTLYLDQLALSDWDVLTYYAKADTAESNSYASEVYFLEVRPFRKDILKLPGGAGGQAYQTLNELSSLIGRQQHIIRQTHQHVQRPPAQEKIREEERKKIAGAEQELGSSVEHLYAEMSANLENKPIGDALDNLAKAQDSLQDASGLLVKEVMSEAQERERAALSELVAARKILQKAVSDHPGDFGQPEQQGESPVADDSAKRLNEMAEFRDEAKSAREFVQQTAEQQKDLAQRAQSASGEQYAPLAAEQKELWTNLDNFAGQHPRAFKGSGEESARARRAMQDAAESLQNQRPESAAAVQDASQNMHKLKQSLQARSSEQQLADVYRLKRMIETAAQALGRSNRDPGAGAPEELARAAQTAQQAIGQLQKALEEPQDGNAFGPALREALSGTNKSGLNEKLARLQQAQTGSDPGQDARSAQAELEQLSQAFGASQPKSLQLAQHTDSLQPGSVEPSNPLAIRADPSDLVKIDPTTLPPAYRGRIEKYFQKLSENSAR